MLLIIIHLSLIHGIFAFSQYYLCRDVSNPNICFEEDNWYMQWPCYTRCCSLHDNTCTTITTDSPLITNKIKKIKSNNNGLYHDDQCIYETNNAFYNLYNLEINPNTKNSYYYSYKSLDYSSSPFYNQSISLYLNLCNKSSVFGTEYNNPPNTDSLNAYISDSIILCSSFISPLLPSDHNNSALCTQTGESNYHTADFRENNNNLIINLGQTTCIYDRGITLRSSNIYINLVIQCDKSTDKTKIISVDGPIFSMDEIYYPCTKNITITMSTNIGCPIDKILANKSYIHCPKNFTETTTLINCTLFTYSTEKGLIGNMSDIRDGYLSIFAEFGMKTNNITINMDIISNKTGVFNITFNVTDIIINKLNHTKQSNWKNISIYAAVNYSIGPNTTTRNISILFVSTHGEASSMSITYVGGYITMVVFIVIVLYLCYRLKDEEARKFCCKYCMRCKCMDYGLRVCLIGSYILCCDCRKHKKINVDLLIRDKDDNKNDKQKKKSSTFQDMKPGLDTLDNENIIGSNQRDSITFWGFIKDKLSKNRGYTSDELANGSEISAYSRYDSMSEFLYKQQSNYATHIGLQRQKSKGSPRQGSINKISISTEEDYVF